MLGDQHDARRVGDLGGLSLGRERLRKVALEVLGRIVGFEGLPECRGRQPAQRDSISVGHIAGGNTGGTDHQSFDAVGLPGFQFIQDPVEYNSRTHHSSQDVYERIQAVDMKHNAVAVATFVYLTANRDELIPRKPLPQVAQGGGRGGAGGGRGGQGPVIGCPAN